MRTACCSGHLMVGVCPMVAAQGGVCLGGVSAEGVCLGGVCLGVYISNLDRILDTLL